MDESSREAEVCDATYGPLKRDGLTGYHWPWATEWAIAKYVGPSRSPQYEGRFRLPNDTLSIRSLWCNQQRVTDFDLNLIDVYVDLNESDELICEVAVDVSEDRFHPMFTEWMTLKLCAYLAGGVVRDNEREQMYFEMAQLKWRQARHTAGSQRTPRDMDTSRLIRVR